MRKWLTIILAVLTLLSLIAEFAGSGENEHGPSHWWYNIPGFFLFFGFGGCVLLVIFSKKLGRWFLLKEEDYYDDK
jgi:peptidoglycan/LPS O-acetylase OafA/YrhL